MIKSFGDPDLKALFEGVRIRRWINIEKALSRKLAEVNRTQMLEDLRFPPGNRLKALSGDRNGQYSIRVNDQFRICFVWRDGHAYDVIIVDCH